MRKTVLFYYFIVTAFLACKAPVQDPAAKAPQPTIAVVHFEEAFFAMDTLHFETSLANLVKKYPQFSADYFDRILMMSPEKEAKSILSFYKAYLPIYKEVKRVQASKMATPALEAALKRLHYYFPNYQLPKQLIYFIGPLETYGNVVTKDGLAIGLQLYMGAKSSWYYSEQINTIYPTYISRQFSPEYIPVNSIQNLLNDYEPIMLNGKNVLTQLIEIGKRQYLLKQCMPATADTILFGYTANQLNAIQDNASAIWTFIASQNRLYSVDPNDTKPLLTEAPYNDYFGEDIPGNVGKYIGYRIVNAWMDQQKGKAKEDLNQLLKTPALTIFNQTEIDF